MKRTSSSQSLRVTETLHKDRIEPLEKLFSARIEELVNLGVFGKYWKRVFGNESRMLIKKALHITENKALTKMRGIDQYHGVLPRVRKARSFHIKARAVSGPRFLFLQFSPI